MTDAIVTEEYQGYQIEVEADQDCGSDSPRDWDNETVMVGSHRRYNFPNEADIDFDAHGSWDEVAAHIRATNEVVALLPVYLYDHSMQAYSTVSFVGRAQHAEWDSGQIGLIYITAEGQKALGTPDALLDEVLRSDVEVYGQWANGEVYGYIVTDPEGEEVDALWGLYGLDYAMAEARAAVDAAVGSKVEA